MQQRNQLLTGLLAMLAVLFLSFGAYFWNSNRAMIRENDLNEQRADSLWSAKLRLEGDVRGLENQLETATDENESLEKRISTLHDQISSRDLALDRLRRRATQKDNTIRTRDLVISTLQTGRDSLENQMEAIRDKINWLTDANTLLLNQNKELQQQLTQLNSALLTNASKSAVTGDAFMIVATKANRKETAKAKKVDKLTVSFDVPAELPIEGVHDVFLSLTDSQQNAVPSPLRDMTISLADVNEVIPVHAVQRVNFGRSPQRISFTLSPGNRLKAGSYRAAVFTKGAYLGSVTVQLRDSFLFF